MSSPKAKTNLTLATRSSPQHSSPQHKQVVPKKRKRDGLSPDHLPALITRMSPSLLERFIKQGPSAQQIDDIKSMGFGGLLELKTDKVPGHLAYWLVSNFNTASCSLLNGALRIVDEDIHLTLGLPMGQTPVKLATTGDKCQTFLDAKKTWLLQFGGADTVSVKEVYEKMVELVDGGPDFKRIFIVYVVSVFLMGIKGSVCSLRILKSLYNVDNISDLNWCGFVRKQLIESVDSWKQSNNPNATFGGPIMVLVFIYLDRVSFKFNEVPRVFPTLSTWTKEAISARLSAEKISGFGQGAVEPRVIKPVTKPSSSRQVERDSNVIESSNLVNQLAEAAIKFAESYDNFYVVLREARAKSPDSDVVRQMVSLAESLFQGYSSVQQDKDKFDDVNVKSCKDNEIQVEAEEDKTVEQSSKDVNVKRTEAFRAFASHKSFGSEDELIAALVKLETALGKRPVSGSQTTQNESGVPTAVPLVFVETESQEFDNVNCAQVVPEKGSSEEQTKEQQTSEHQTSKQQTGKQQTSEQQMAVETDAKGVHPEKINEDVIDLGGVSPVIRQSRKKTRISQGAPQVRRSPRISSQTFSPPSFKLISSADFEETNEVNCGQMMPEKSLSAEGTEKKQSEGDNTNRPWSCADATTEKMLDDVIDLVCESADVHDVHKRTKKTSESPLLQSPTSAVRRSSRLSPQSLSAPSFKSASNPESQRTVSRPQPIDAQPISCLVTEDAQLGQIKRTVQISDVFKSPYLERVINIQLDITPSEKQVVDFVLSESLDDSEILFRCDDLTLSRGVLKTLFIGDRVSESIIKCWCHLMNKNEKFKSKESPSRLWLPYPEYHVS